ncbi:MAG: hypothetical protein U0S48_18600 [Solirubrobacteraceae bacterium]
MRAIGGEPAKPGTWITLVSQVTMDDERQLDWHPPQPVAFSLVEAHKLVRRAVPKRRNIIDNLKRRTNDAYGPQNSHRTLDVIADLWSAVLHSFAAVEAIANDSIDRLPNDAVITIGRKDDTREIEKSDMVRALNISEKLSQAVPLLDIGEQTKGTRPWERFVHLKRLRDDLVHVKDPGDQRRIHRPGPPSTTGSCSATATRARGTPSRSCRRIDPASSAITPSSTCRGRRTPPCPPFLTVAHQGEHREIRNCKVAQPWRRLASMT